MAPNLAGERAGDRPYLTRRQEGSNEPLSLFARAVVLELFHASASSAPTSFFCQGTDPTPSFLKNFRAVQVASKQASPFKCTLPEPVLKSVLKICTVRTG